MSNISDRITEYLASGGLFNPEAMEHEKVRALLIDCRAYVDTLTTLVRAQAEDEGLWFQAATAPEAYLQDALRRLHHAIEGTTP